MALSQAFSLTGLASEGLSSGRVRSGCIHRVATDTSTKASDWLVTGAGAAARAAASDPEPPAGRHPMLASRTSAKPVVASVSRK
jgi:hypothetical protein